MDRIETSYGRAGQNKWRDSAQGRGFTVVELLVTVSIFVFMTALIIFRYGSFNQGALLTNLAYNVASTIRLAQTYGISVKATDPVSGSQQFNAAYGVYFNMQIATGANSFILFADKPNGSVPPNGQYDGSDDTLSTYYLTQGAKFTALCTGTQASDCKTNPVLRLSITFNRPDPSAIFYTCTGTCSTSIHDTHTYAAITVSSADGSSARTIVVRKNGQITVMSKI
jgi:Tfp pilus assembly protein FimT